MANTEASANPFAEWLKRHGLTMRAAADVLGCSTSAVQDWKLGKAKPPKYVLMACAAYSTGVPPIR